MRQEKVIIMVMSVKVLLRKEVLLSSAKGCHTASVGSVNLSCFKSRMYRHLNKNLELRPKHRKFVCVTLG